MKKLAVLVAMVAMMVLPVAAQKNDDGVSVKEIKTTKISVGEKSAMAKLGNGIARIATLGMYQPAEGLKANAPFALAFDHDGYETTSYQIFLNGVLHTTLPVTALVLQTGVTPPTGTVTLQFPQGLAKGSYTFLIKAVGPGGEASAAPLAQVVTPGNPNAPRNPRIIKT